MMCMNGSGAEEAETTKASSGTICTSIKDLDMFVEVQMVQYSSEFFLLNDHAWRTDIHMSGNQVKLAI